MNEQQKPLTTEQIAGGSQEMSGDHRIEKRDEIEANERMMSGGSSAVQTQDRDGMEAGYSESGMSNGNSSPALMPVETAKEHREHWTDIQVRFVDDPRDAVEQADELV